MKRIQRLFVLVGSGIVTSIVVIYLAHYLVEIYNITEIASKATIVGGVLTFLGTVFTAVYKEISAYYNDKTTNVSKKWEIILPFIKAHYNPWINSAHSLVDALKRISEKSPTDDQTIRVLFLTAVFYGYRLRFILKDGGLVLLSSIDEENKVNDAYRAVVYSFQWDGTSTPNKVSELQGLFVSKDKPENPYVLSRFTKDVEKTTSLKTSKSIMKEWISNVENRSKLVDQLNNFATIFKTGIDKLYTDWEG